ncbi:hypothetical protein ACTFIY_012299 [Dictyostelium cf. discoideum]
MSSFIRYGIKRIQKRNDFGNLSDRNFRFYVNSNKSDFIYFGNHSTLHRANCASGSNNLVITRTYLVSEVGSDTVPSKEVLETFTSPFEKQLNLIESQNSDIMNEYYNLLRNEQPKNMGAFIFLGFNCGEVLDTSRAVDKIMGVQLFSDFEVLKKVYYIHCRRNKDSVTSFEIKNSDGSRNFKKIYNIDTIKSVLKIFNENENEGVYSSREIIFESPNTDNYTLILTPHFLNQLEKRTTNEVIRKQILNAIFLRYPNPVFVPIVSGLKPFLENENETSLCKHYDIYSTSTISVVTDRDQKLITRELLTPDSWIKIMKDDDVDQKIIEIKNRIYKFFFRNNSSYFQDLITNRLKTVKALLEGSSGLTRGSFSLNVLLFFLSEWDFHSMSLKQFIGKRIEKKLTSILVSRMGDLNMDKIDFSEFNEEREMAISEIYDTFNKVTGYEQTDLDESSFVNFKNQWLFFSKSLRGEELPNHYINIYSKQFIDSISKIPEVSGISESKYPSIFEISWNRNYKKALSSLMDDDYILNLQSQIINDVATGIDNFTKEKAYNVPVLGYVLRNEAFNFTNTMDCNVFCQLISKEFSPSVTYEEFRECVNQVYSSNDIQELKLLGFSSLWNYIYFRALSKKLSREIVNASMGSIIKHVILRSIENIGYLKHSSQNSFISLDEIPKLLKSGEMLKKSFGFKSLSNKK